MSERLRFRGSGLSIGTWDEGIWVPPEQIGADISTEYEEIELGVNGTGDKLYFARKRPCGILKALPFLSPDESGTTGQWA